MAQTANSISITTEIYIRATNQTKLERFFFDCDAFEVLDDDSSNVGCDRGLGGAEVDCFAKDWGSGGITRIGGG